MMVDGKVADERVSGRGERASRRRATRSQDAMRCGAVRCSAVQSRCVRRGVWSTDKAFRRDTANAVDSIVTIDNTPEEKENWVCYFVWDRLGVAVVVKKLVESREEGTVVSVIDGLSFGLFSCCTGTLDTLAQLATLVVQSVTKQFNLGRYCQEPSRPEVSSMELEYGRCSRPAGSPSVTPL